MTFIAHSGTSQTSHVTHVAFTPCTGPVSAALDPADAVDFDTIKAGNFGTATERPNLANRALNAKRLAFRYVVFAHNVVGNPTVAAPTARAAGRSAGTTRSSRSEASPRRR